MPPKHSKSTKITVSLRLIPDRCYQLYYRDIASGEKIRRSTGTFDPIESERLREQLEAQLRLGLFPTTRPALFGPDMLIEEFCSQYDRLHWKANNLRDSSRKAALSRIRLVAVAAGALTLGQLNSRDKRELAQGVLQGQNLSEHTVKNYLVTVNAALRWAEGRDWLKNVPRVKLLKTSHLKGAKGRPITTEEFERLLSQLDKIVGQEQSAAYQLPARILLAQGLRL